MKQRPDGAKAGQRGRLGLGYRLKQSLGDWELGLGTLGLNKA